MTADQTELERFAERLIQLVRDRAIGVCDQLAAGEMRGPDGDRWRALLGTVEARQALHELIPDIVDQTLFHVLNAVDNDDLPLGWRNADGLFVALEELGKGELAGWLMGGQGGWLDRFSQQRFVDALADLELNLEADGNNHRDKGRSV